MIREHITRTLGELPGGRPVVLLGHSLGGIAAVDLLAGRTMDPRVKLLVTVGSQAPLLYLMDALDTLTYRAEGISTRPFTPWLNIYDPSDLLSFLAGPVWPGESGIADERVDSGASVFAAHSAYWGTPGVRPDRRALARGLRRENRHGPRPGPQRSRPGGRAVRFTSGAIRSASGAASRSAGAWGPQRPYGRRGAHGPPPSAPR
nr:hypothetical protein GCM10020093_038470 [Planobispora longispora]